MFPPVLRARVVRVFLGRAIMEGFYSAHHDPNTQPVAGAAYGDTGVGRRGGKRSGEEFYISI